MRLPKFTAEQSLDSPGGRFFGRALSVDPRGAEIVSDVKCLLLDKINVLYCPHCLCAEDDCFTLRS